MKKIILTLCSITLATGLLAGCQNSDVGLVAGGVGGAALGSVVTGGSAVGTAVGAVGGAFVGHSLAE